MRRIFCYCGAPQSILVDNGTQFTAQETQTFSRGTVLHFNPSNFALVGRDFQEIIRAVKRLLRKVLMTLRVTPKKWKKMPRK